jgi:hypothetical protein
MSRAPRIQADGRRGSARARLLFAALGAVLALVVAFVALDRERTRPERADHAAAADGDGIDARAQRSALVPVGPSAGEGLVPSEPLVAPPQDRRAALAGDATTRPGRVVLAQADADVPCERDGRLELAGRGPDGRFVVVAAVVERGAFAVPLGFEPTCLVRADLDVGGTRAIHEPASDAPIATDAHGLVVRLADLRTRRFDVRDAVTLEPLAAAVFVAPDGRRLIARFDGTCHVADLPLEIASLGVGAPGYLGADCDVPGFAQEWPTRVLLVPLGRLEIAVVGASPSAAFAVELLDRGPSRAGSARRVAFQGASTVVDDVPATALLAVLSDAATGAELDRVGVLMEAGRARAVFVPGRPADARDGRLEIGAARAPTDPQRMRIVLSAETGELVLRDVELEGASLAVDLVATPDGARFESALDVRAGVFRLSATDLGGALVQAEVRPGETTRVELVRRERTQVELRAHDAASCASIAGLGATWVSTSDRHHTSGGVTGERARERLAFEVEVGRVVVSVHADLDGRRFEGRSEFVAEPGRVARLDVPLVERPDLRWLEVVRAPGSEPAGRDWGPLVLEPTGRVLPQVQRRRGVDGHARLEVGVRTLASHVLVVPNDGADTASLWVELSGEGSVRVELPAPQR